MNFKICSLLILSAFTFNCINGSNVQPGSHNDKVIAVQSCASEVEYAELLVRDNLERLKRNPDSKELQACLEKSQAYLASAKSRAGLIANTPGETA